MVKERFKVDIWDFINIESINNQLEKHLENKKIDGIPSDINYKCLIIGELGTLELEAEFELEKIE